MQVVPVEHNRVPRLHTADAKTHVSNRKTTMTKKGKKGIILPPLSRVIRPVADILQVMTNQTTLQLMMCQQT